MSFEKGDKVRVRDGRSVFSGKDGVIERSDFQDECGISYVLLDGDSTARAFWHDELELVVRHREALIELADLLNEARITAQFAEADVVVEQTMQALLSTLEAIFAERGADNASWRAERAHTALLYVYGSGIREAIATAEAAQ